MVTGLAPTRISPTWPHGIIRTTERTRPTRCQQPRSLDENLTRPTLKREYEREKSCLKTAFAEVHDKEK